MKRINIKELIKNKKYVLIIGIIAFILLVAGATYAYFSWTSNKINSVVSSRCFEIFYEKGNDIEGEIIPSYDYTGGLYSVAKMDINSSCNIDAIGKLYLNVSEETSTNLYREGLLNYQVLKNGELTDIKGNITSAGEIELNLGQLSKNTSAVTEYTIYVWVDYNLVTNSDIGSKFVGSIRGEAIQGFAQETEETLVTHITNLYLNNKDTDLVENNDILYRYASIYDKDDSDTTSGGLMNDRHGSMDTEEDDGNIRYYGANPNNYIYFNCSDYSNQSESTCEVWRIIGVFDGKVKIMKNGTIGNLSWDQNKNNLNGTSTDTSYNNDWSNSSLQEFLNGKYYDRGEDTTYTYYNGSDGSSSVDINLESFGIKNDTTRGLISESLWYLKGWNNTSIYSDQMYDYERNSGGVAVTGQPTTIPGNIAIPYVSDYGYAADLGSCSGKTLAQYNDTTCTSANWMKTILAPSYGWLMAPNSSSSSYAWNVLSPGLVFATALVYNALGVAPVLHLNSELSIKTGDGSQNTPYQIAIG